MSPFRSLENEKNQISNIEQVTAEIEAWNFNGLYIHIFDDSFTLQSKSDIGYSAVRFIELSII